MTECQDVYGKTSELSAQLNRWMVKKKGISIKEVAELIHVSYKVFRHRAMMRMVEQRQVRNMKFLEKQENEIKHELEKLKISQQTRQHTKDEQDSIEIVDECYMSLMSPVEAFQEGDCMCIGFELSRSEAAVIDPGQLVVNHITSTFITAKSFLDSTINAGSSSMGELHPEARGSLAMGVGRENINAVMPLYIFQEHWEVARRLQP